MIEGKKVFKATNNWVKFHKIKTFCREKNNKYKIYVIFATEKITDLPRKHGLKFILKSRELYLVFSKYDESLYSDIEKYAWASTEWKKRLYIANI